MSMTLEPTQSNEPTPTDIDESFSINFSNLRSFRCYRQVNNIINMDSSNNFFKNFKNLSRLELANNGLTKLPASIADLNSLQWIEISNNQIEYSSLISSFANLHQLSKLKLENLKCNTLSKKISLIKIPSSLVYLSLIDFQQNFMPVDLTTTSNLKILKCTGVPLVTSVTDYNNNNEHHLLSLEKAIEMYDRFFVKDKGRQQLEDLFEIIHAGPTEFLNSREISKFNAFIFKRFPRLGDNIIIGPETGNFCFFTHNYIYS